MSLSRLALRLATLEALAPSAIKNPAGPWPTLAKSYVYLSRLDPINDLAPTEQRKVAVIYTEEEENDPRQAVGWAPFDKVVDLVIELSVVAEVTEDGTTFDVGAPFLDDELETALDLFEAQVMFALIYGPTGKLWRDGLARKIHSTHSAARRGSEEAMRLAIRTLRIKMTIPDDGYKARPTGLETGNDRLPEPLRTVANAFAPGSYGAGIIAGILGQVPQAPVLPAFGGAKMTFQPGAPPQAEDDTRSQIVASAPQSALQSPPLLDFRMERDGMYLALFEDELMLAVPSNLDFEAPGNSGELVLMEDV